MSRSHGWFAKAKMAGIRNAVGALSSTLSIVDLFCKNSVSVFDFYIEFPCAEYGYWIISMDIINPNEVACICKGLLTDGLGPDILVNAVVLCRLGYTRPDI
ncbi:hypothetical protein [Microbulbifer sp. JMSA003]|uniref:hypothetical protein n=1 Tax=unclassified Microbulbifer TaxID=2619833 RepID=UPI004039CD34